MVYSGLGSFTVRKREGNREIQYRPPGLLVSFRHLQVPCGMERKLKSGCGLLGNKIHILSLCLGSKEGCWIHPQQEDVWRSYLTLKEKKKLIVKDAFWLQSDIQHE